MSTRGPERPSFVPCKGTPLTYLDAIPIKQEGDGDQDQLYAGQESGAPLDAKLP